MYLCVWLPLLIMMFVRFNHVDVGNQFSPSHHCIVSHFVKAIQCIHHTVNGHEGGLEFGAVTNKIMLWTFVQMCFGKHTYAFVLGLNLQTESLSHRLCVFSTVINTSKQFSKVVLI